MDGRNGAEIGKELKMGKKTKHTPGPWMAEKWHHKSEQYGTGWSIRPFNHKTNDWTGHQLAIVDGDDHGFSSVKSMGGTSEANAALIAAAPDMLEALNYCVNMIGAYDRNFRLCLGNGGQVDGDDLRKAAENADAAIAKAKGTN